MTHNPTPAEVQAAYDNAVNMLERKHFALTDDVKVLLAAVARDTLGWREVTWGNWHECGEHARFESNVGPDRQDRYWIKDAPT